MPFINTFNWRIQSQLVRFDPQFMEKRSVYINEAGKDLLTGKEVSQADIEKIIRTFLKME